MKKYRCVPEIELLSILKAANKYWALESNDVDEWEWYGDSIYDYLENWIAELDLNPSGDWDFDSIAENDIYKYPSLEL